MKLRKGRKHTINLGNYESVTFSAEVEVDTDTDYPLDTVPDDEEIIEYLDEVLGKALDGDIRHIAEFANEDSHAHHLNKMLKD